MGSKIIIVNGQSFSKAEILALLRRVIDFVPESVQEDARYVEDYFSEASAQEIELTLLRLSGSKFIADAKNWSVVFSKSRTPKQVDSLRETITLSIRNGLDPLDRTSRIGDKKNRARVIESIFEEEDDDLIEFRGLMRGEYDAR